MTEYDERVRRQRMRLEAEKWASGVKCIHAHQLKSMWYDDRPQDTDSSGVVDVQYNDGRIRRTIQETGEIVWMGQKLTGEDLVHEYSRHS